MILATLIVVNTGVTVPLMAICVAVVVAPKAVVHRVRLCRLLLGLARVVTLPTVETTLFPITIAAVKVPVAVAPVCAMKTTHLRISHKPQTMLTGVRAAPPMWCIPVQPPLFWALNKLKRLSMNILNRIIIILLLVGANTVLAKDKTAQVNYMLNCQGCHTPDGQGSPEKGVPTLKNFMGKFLTVKGGREFLIQVPGASQSTLNSAQLAQMTNWMLKSFDPDSINENFQPYSAQEVARLRKVKLIKVSETRKRLLEQIKASSN